MNQLGIVHPGLLDKIQPNFYPTTCAIHDRQTGDGYAQAADTPAADPVDGLDDIPCRISPILVATGETRRPEQAWAENRFHIALGGYYATIDATQYVKADGTFYEIDTPPQHDGNGKTTRLICRIVT